MGQIAPWYELAVDQRHRTTVGISEVDILDAARFLIDFIEDPSSPSPRPEVETGHVVIAFIWLTLCEREVISSASTC